MRRGFDLGTKVKAAKFLVLSLRLLEVLLFSIRYGCLKINITGVEKRKEREKMKINSRWPTQHVANYTTSRDDIIFGPG